MKVHLKYSLESIDFGLLIDIMEPHDREPAK